MYFNLKKSEFSDLEYKFSEDISALQNSLLTEQIKYTVEKSPFYRDTFRRNKISISDISSVDDLMKIPCTEKSDITKNNEAFLAAEKKDIVDICLTSATTGEIPTKLYQTRSDLERLAYNEEKAFATMGLTCDDTMLITAAIDRCFMAGLAYFLGGVNLGTCMIRAGSGSAAQQWNLLKTLSATSMIGVPSLMAKIGEYAIENGENPALSGVKKIAAIGEPTRDEKLKLLPASEKIERLFNTQIYSTYASTELATTFCECEERKGGHLRPELIIVEILDEKNQRVKNGEKGEITVTPLGITGTPLIRFKTGDISYIIEEPCRCKRNTIRLAPVLGRKNQMMKYKGTTIFPGAILSVIDGYDEAIGGYVEAFGNDDNTDRIVLNIAMKKQSSKISEIADLLRSKIRVVPEIVIITDEEYYKKALSSEKRKKICFFDYRGKND